VGWWFSYERAFWSLSQPDRSEIGAPPLNLPIIPVPPFFGGDPVQPVDNSFIRAIGAWGNRWEVGYMDNTNYGWFVSVLDHISQGQYQIVNEPIITFGDPNQLLEAFLIDPPDVFDVGQIPGAFRVLEMKSQTILNGVELSREYRAARLHKGGYLEVIYGARWFQIDDSFIVKGFGNGEDTISITNGDVTGNYPRNALDESKWSTRSSNNLIGPQIGLRWFRQRDHWITSVEGRFLAAANFQNTNQVTELGTNEFGRISPPSRLAFLGLGTRTHQNNTVFSPLGELRVTVSYLVGRSAALKVGYTGIVTGGISRASNRVDYNSPNLIGILPANNREVFFVNGLNFGVEFNR
jgi:hypothetical protein